VSARVSVLGETGGIRTASQSDVGRSRHDNQDAHGDFRGKRGERLLVVADGMGGHLGGATASRICVETLGAVLEESKGAPYERLERGLLDANTRIRAAAGRDPDLAGMGTTAVALLFGNDGRAWLGWVGDSRAYRARGGTLEPLSSDHSVVAEWVKAGILEADEAERHPRRNELLRALGASDSLEPELRELEVEPGDRFLLCSDGLSAVVPLAEIAGVVATEDPERATKTLVALANQYGGPDNVTVVIAAVPLETVTLPLRKIPAPPANRSRLWLALAAVVAVSLLAAALYGLLPVHE